jgi:hypothetical protein
MTANATTPPWQAPLAWLAVCRAARLPIVGFVGWLWFHPADDSAWAAVSLVAVLALAALVGITCYLSRARAERRWWASLDRYAKQEQAKRTHPRRRHQRSGRLT